DVAGVGWRVETADILHVAVAERAAGVVTPAANRTVVHDRAGVAVTSLDRDGRAADGDVACGRRSLVVADVVGVAIAQHAPTAAAPASHRAVLEQRTGVGATRSNCGHGSTD